ncbi:MAG: hypothetical protein O7G85_15670 [Planctomycetota bacterium]|nr:hypothetical protein [Planctomycetota bacterium]
MFTAYIGSSRVSTCLAVSLERAGFVPGLRDDVQIAHAGPEALMTDPDVFA